MNLRVEKPDGEDLPIVAVHGELDLDGAPELRRALIEAIDEHPGRPLVVDLEGVDFIDSAGLGVLVGGLKRAKDAEGDLVLVATGHSVIGCSSSPGSPACSRSTRRARRRSAPTSERRLRPRRRRRTARRPRGRHAPRAARAGIRPDLVLGTSVGAINGAAVAADPSAAGVERLAAMWSAIDRTDVLGGSVLGRLARWPARAPICTTASSCARC